MKMEDQDRPLVTFALLGYGQEKYIGEAIKGAFAQTYSPLEIIISDDSSPDATFQIMEEMARNYSGPHQVQVRRTACNIGLSAHLDEVAKLAHGEWIVIAAGDDISLPERTTHHMRLAGEHPRAYSTFLAPVVIGDCRSDESVPKISDRVLCYPETVKSHGGGILGATHALKKISWEIFGNLGKGCICEDWALAFRSSLIGEVVWEKTLGVSYRLHEASITSQNFGVQRYDKQLMVESAALRQFAKDLKKAIASGYVPEDQGKADLEWLQEALLSNDLIAECTNTKSIGEALAASIRLLLARQFVVGNYRRRLGIVKSSLSKHFRK